MKERHVIDCWTVVIVGWLIGRAWTLSQRKSCGLSLVFLGPAKAGLEAILLLVSSAVIQMHTRLPLGNSVTKFIV